MKLRLSVSRRAGFTLIELLVAIAMMATLLAALLSFVFSMTEIWGQGSEKRLFEQHVAAVTQHLESMLRRAALPVAGDAPAEAFSVREIRTPSSGNVTGLSFILSDGDRLLNWGGTPAPLTECTLEVVDGNGLMIFWRSRLEEDEDAIHETVVSPLITQLGYHYYDADTRQWRSETRLRRNSSNLWMVPEQIVVQFTHDKQTATRVLTLPLAPGGVPLF
jgi:prepilin-type N-terminal cleavage/methylation domain-containing protein